MTGDNRFGFVCGADSGGELDGNKHLNAVYRQAIDPFSRHQAQQHLRANFYETPCQDALDAMLAGEIYHMHNPWAMRAFP